MNPTELVMTEFSYDSITVLKDIFKNVAFIRIIYAL